MGTELINNPPKFLQQHHRQSSCYSKNLSVQHQQKWPSLNILSNLDIIPNGKNRKQFPNPLIDKCIQLTCQFRKNKTRKVRVIRMVYETSNGNPNDMLFTQCEDETEIDHENCEFFIALDKIHCENSSTESKPVLSCDIREHSAVHKWISDEATGFWIRLFGPKNKFTFYISLYQYLGGKHKGKLHRSKLMKVNELQFEIENEGPTVRKPVKKVNFEIQSSFQRKNFVGSNYHPSLCEKEIYSKITSSLQLCLNNGDVSEFCKLYDNFYESAETEVFDGSFNSTEVKLLLSTEKSQLHALKSEFVKAKKLLQQVVGKIVSKTPNRVFLLNKAYSSLANVHLIEGNFGTAEDCLNFLQYDKKNGIPFEQVGYFYLLNGEMLMNFSKKTPEMREQLLLESDNSFRKAEEALQECLPESFENICKLNLLRARLYVCEHYSNCCGSNIEKVISFKEKVERHEESLSLRTKCHLYLVQSECYFYEGKFQEADGTLSKFKDMSKIFPELSLIYKKVEQQREHIKKQNYSSVIKDIDLDINDPYYDADESSEMTI